ncbi:lysozyme inhibitor LprI family protein [Biformimicrobium ophioploci]|uniref:Lysozyme inhibitor LprI-like N-terminal domain-containing protein n=1 Tax=Biformimicrobium ophioploci TaxID=3036711 RepID=A0ABQ6LW88_9GAMM|nr:lysozyme inhibitor LprI family protein [Microbulbifer sp. NKW57]GMG86358.1 hypothetical protein MNKW57_06790 [Microbulbifer sp. NKW57]
MVTARGLRAILPAALLLFAAGCSNADPQTAKTLPPDETRGAGMHPGWDVDGDGINDCEKDGSCDHTVDYSRPRERSVIAVTPSFPCTPRLQSSIEQMICLDTGLAALDRELAEVFQKALEKTVDENEQKYLRAEQRGWIKGRNDCWKSEDRRRCAEESYRRRIAELNDRYQLGNG